ncbi:hypothetical protein PV04_02645 [Phialophora macrospora]|uniref:DNA (cytosine-5-)-methyltransferase n=1 Tax=Phialophora macrospora TaxID=1851006 RepID=A0A0D2CYT2_9EURO|nr:hypothetical protein PV04_02645 [Phialophora macrospora]
MPASDEDDDYSSDIAYETGDENNDFKKRKVVRLAFTKSYAPDWVERDAFREFYQNWRDGIIESFNLRPDLVRPVFVRNDCREIHITASMAAESSAGTVPPKLLGYIIFKSRQGTLEMTNLGAKLERRHLDLGETNKRDDARSAGGHGEGFKVGALVLRRNGYSVKFETDSLYWNFAFAKERPLLCCALTKPQQSVKDKLRDNHWKQQRTPNYTRGLTARIWEDMTVKIGKSKEDKHGVEPKKSGISEETFRSWLTVSLDLDPPDAAQVIRTPSGDLIFDSRYRGRVYLKSLLVSEFGDRRSGGKNYRFGYNFNSGKINRDRQSVVNPHEEARMLAKIWESAIAMKGEAIIDSYVDLFNQDGEVPDIAMALDNVSALTAANICNHLKVFHPDAFFYSERRESEQNPTTDEDIISQELKKQPFKLAKTLWQIMRKYQDQHGRPLMHTPLEERKHLFQMSSPIGLPTDAFGLNIVRALKGSFSLDIKLADLRFEFVDGAQTSISLLYDQNLKVLLIHGKWLNFAQMHRGSICEFFRVIGRKSADGGHGFVCDHVVQDLLEAAFEELRIPLGLTQGRASCLRRNAAESLRQMPRAISLSVPRSGRTLMVSWIGNESGMMVQKFGANIHYSVTLHKASSCRTKAEEVLNITAPETDISYAGSPSTEPDREEKPCGCPTRVVARLYSKAVFKGLDHTEAYFPMVSRTKGPSFFGLPPAALKPRARKSAAAKPRDLSFSMESLPSDFNDSEHFASDSDDSIEDPLNDVYDSTAQEDERSWADWEEHHLPKAFSGHIRPRKSNFQFHGAHMQAPLHDQDLNFTFEKRQYAWVQLNGELGEQVIYIHDIFQQEDHSDVNHYLLATFYSPLGKTFPFRKVPTASNGEQHGNELILHSSHFNRMKTPEDAELILLADISAARCLDAGRTTVSHVFQHVPDDHRELFCRFAICDFAAEDTASLTPLAAHLLETREAPWSRPEFRSPATPLTFDLSPEILGMSEGFSQAGFIIQAAFGIDESRPSTWKDRHNSSQTFDGAVLGIFDDLNTRKLLPVQLPDPVPPRIVLFASKHTHFKINELNRHMPTLDQFLHDLEVIDKAAAEEGPNFLVMIMTPAFLHSSAISRFSETILGLLQMRYSVHMKLVQVKSFGLPQERNILIIVASPICAPLPWKDEKYTIQPTDVVDLGELIADLSFENDRRVEEERSGFVCSQPQDDRRPRISSLVHVYNHYTGISVADGPGVIQVEAATTLSLVDGPKQWKHPDRPDRLTVRELARVQGIPDDFKFWGPIESQYEAVCKAIPPVIARMVADTILQAIRNTLPVTVDTPRRKKRARVAIVEEHD